MAKKKKHTVWLITNELAGQFWTTTGWQDADKMPDTHLMMTFETQEAAEAVFEANNLQDRVGAEVVAYLVIEA